MSLKACRDSLLAPLVRAAAAFHAREGWTCFGYARLDDFARERLSRSGRWLRDLVALGPLMESMPVLVQAVTGEDGGPPIGRVAATLIGKIATVASVTAWIERARRVTIRELKEQVRVARGTGSQWPPGARDGEEDGGAETFDERQSSAGAERSPTAVSEDGDDPDRALVRLLVPVSVKAAFEEALELHRAVSGHEATVTSFADALVAEALSGPCPPDAECVPLQRRAGTDLIEAALARATGRWQGLPDRAHMEGDAPAVARSRKILERLQGVVRSAGSGAPAELDSQLREMVFLDEEIERCLGSLLVEMSERGAWARLSFSGVGHYSEQRLGLSRTSAEDRAALARSLRNLPLVREAYEGGRIRFQAALTLRRLLGSASLVEEDERAWVRRAEEATVKRLKDEARVCVRLEALNSSVSRGAGWYGRPPQDGERQAKDGADGKRGWIPRPASDGAWHESLQREAGATLLRVARLARDAAESGSAEVFLRMRLPRESAAALLSCVESRRRQISECVEQVPWHEPWPDPEAAGSLLAARTFSIRCRRIPSWVGLLALIEEYVASWDDPRRSPRRSSEAIYARDGWRCMAPGCTSRRNLEDHHVWYRSMGGKNESSNRLCLCQFHHRQGEHGTLASCRGEAPLGILWRLGKEGLGGWFPNERRVG